MSENLKTYWVTFFGKEDDYKYEVYATSANEALKEATWIHNEAGLPSLEVFSIYYEGE